MNRTPPLIRVTATLVAVLLAAPPAHAWLVKKGEEVQLKLTDTGNFGVGAVPPEGSTYRYRLTVRGDTDDTTGYALWVSGKTTNSNPGILVRNDGAVAINVDASKIATNSAHLVVGGGVKFDKSVQLGNDTATCNTAKAGTIRWTGTAFEGCTGTAWAALGGGGSVSVDDRVEFPGSGVFWQYDAAGCSAVPPDGHRDVNAQASKLCKSKGYIYNYKVGSQKCVRLFGKDLNQVLFISAANDNNYATTVAAYDGMAYYHYVTSIQCIAK